VVKHEEKPTVVKHHPKEKKHEKPVEKHEETISIDKIDDITPLDKYEIKPVVKHHMEKEVKK